MFKLVTQLLLHKQLKFEKGRISLLNENVAIAPITTYVGILKNLEGTKQENALYLGAKETGVSWNKKMQNIYKTKTVDEIFEWGMKIVTMSGWGDFKVIKYDREKNKFRYRLQDSTLAKGYGNSDHPVCQIPRGFFAGSACFLTKLDLDCVETKCVSMGAPFCEFEIKKKSEFSNSSLIRRQLE
jgi:predicted hydrocarbon binding protein